MHELSTLTLYCHCQLMRRTYPCSAFYEAQVERAHLFQEQSLVHLYHQGLTALRTAWLLQCSSYSSANSYRDSVKYKWCYDTRGSVNKYARHAAKHRHRGKKVQREDKDLSGVTTETHFYAQVSHGQFHIGAMGGHLFTIQAVMEPTQCSTRFPGEQTYICEQVLFCLFTPELSRFHKDVLERDAFYTNSILLMIYCAEPFYTGTSQLPRRALKTE